MSNVSHCVSVPIRKLELTANILNNIFDDARQRNSFA